MELAAEREELPRQRARLVARLEDLFRQMLDIRLGTVERKDLGASTDDRQEVVEVMGDATGEVSNCLHLLGLVKARLELGLARGVA